MLTGAALRISNLMTRTYIARFHRVRILQRVKALAASFRVATATLLAQVLAAVTAGVSLFQTAFRAVFRVFYRRRIVWWQV